METFFSRINILGTRIDNVTEAEALRRISALLDSGRTSMIATVNPEFLMEARHNTEFRSALNASILNVPDGFGIRLVCLWRGIRIKERVTGADVLVRMCQMASERHQGVFLFGAMDGVALAAAAELKRQFPNLVIAGAENEFDSDGQERSEEQVCERIRNAKPAILFVALGAPKQEFWIRKNLAKLPSVRVAMGVGGSFEYLSGDLRRAPQFFRRIGFEWLWRLLLQPGRWRRIVTAVFIFPWTVLRTPRAIVTELS